MLIDFENKKINRYRYSVIKLINNLNNSFMILFFQRVDLEQLKQLNIITIKSSLLKLSLASSNINNKYYIYNNIVIVFLTYKEFLNYFNKLNYLFDINKHIYLQSFVNFSCKKTNLLSFNYNWLITICKIFKNIINLNIVKSFYKILLYYVFIKMVINKLRFINLLMAGIA